MVLTEKKDMTKLCMKCKEEKSVDCFSSIPVKERLWYTSQGSKYLWYEKNPGECDSMYFPKATWLMKNYPWLAVRIFWICIKIKMIYIKIKEIL
jgi:hypothetical protein